MIVGTGIDIIRISRVRQTLARYGDRFLARVFTENERAYCLRKADPLPSLAARFAAKEAAFKALGGTRRPYWRDMEVVNQPGGRPELRLHGVMAERHPATHLHCSLTHDGDTAMAHVIAEQLES